MQEFVWNSFTTEARGGSIEEKEETPVHNSGISFHHVFMPTYPYIVPTNNCCLLTLDLCMPNLNRCTSVLKWSLSIINWYSNAQFSTCVFQSSTFKWCLTTLSWCLLLCPVLWCSLHFYFYFCLRLLYSSRTVYSEPLYLTWNTLKQIWRQHPDLKMYMSLIKTIL